MREKPVENIVGNDEKAGYEHFLLFPQYFVCHEIQILLNE